MEALIAYLDTHVIVRFAGKAQRGIPKSVVRALDDAKEIRLSPMVVLELQMLREMGRLAAAPSDFIGLFGQRFPLRTCDLPFGDVVEIASAMSWTRDPFDRLIVAHADLAKAVLVTKDGTMHAHYPRALW